MSILGGTVWLGPANALKDFAHYYKAAATMMEREPHKVAEFHDLKSRTQAGDFEEGIHSYLVSRTGKQGRTAMIHISGGMVHEAEWWHPYMGVTSYEALISALITAENDDSIDSVILNMRTPGGMVSGIDTVTDIMSRMTKPIVSYTDATIASAGYWISSQANMIGSSRGAQIGSVGVLYIHQSIKRMLEDFGVDIKIYRVGDNKARVNPYEDMREEDEEALIADLEQTYQDFAEQIVAGRGTKLKSMDVPKLTEGGKMFPAKLALEKGLIDFVASIQDVVAYVDENLNNNEDENNSLQL